MNENKQSIKGNKEAGIYYLIGNLFNKGITFLTIPIFTRILTTSDYGIVNTYLAWVPILSVILGLALSSTIRNAFVDFESDIDAYISSIFKLTIVSTIVMTCIILILKKVFFREINTGIIVMCIIQAFMTSVYNTIDNKYMMSFDYKKKTKLLVFPNIFIVILSIILVLSLNRNRYIGRILPFVVVMSFIGSFYLLKYIRIPTKNKDYWVYGIRLSVPLILHGISVNILSTSDRSMLTYFLGSSESGIYSLVYSISMMIMVVTTSLDSIWIPWFTSKLKSKQYDLINKNANHYIYLILIIMVLTIFVTPEILVIMAPKEYWHGKILMPPLVLAAFLIFLYTLNVNVEYYYHSTKIMALSTVVAASLNIILNVLFIPAFGILGASITTVLSYLVSFCMHYNTAHKLNTNLFAKRMFGIPLLILMIYIGIFYIVIDMQVIRLGIALLTLIFYLILNRKVIKENFK